MEYLCQALAPVPSIGTKLYLQAESPIVTPIFKLFNGLFRYFSDKRLRRGAGLRLRGEQERLEMVITWSAQKSSSSEPGWQGFVVRGALWKAGCG